jgi:hypothetical protein
MTAKFAALTGSLIVGKGEAQPMSSGGWASSAGPADAPGLRVVHDRVASKHRHLRIENVMLQADALHAKLNRVTVRLHPAHYLRAKLAAVHMGCSLQDLFRRALDSYLDRAAETVREGDCACLNASLAAAGVEERVQEHGPDHAAPIDPSV